MFKLRQVHQLTRPRAAGGAHQGCTAGGESESLPTATLMRAGRGRRIAFLPAATASWKKIEDALRAAASFRASTLRRLALYTIAALGIAAGTTAIPAQAANGYPDLMWFNPTSGVVSSWLLDGAGHVLGTQPLSYTCTAASGCSGQWHPIGPSFINGHVSLTWFNPPTGVVSSWLTDGAGHVVGTQQLNWTCSAASGCSGQWHPVGNPVFSGPSDLMWFNPTTGVVSTWLTDDTGNVVGTQQLNWTCTAASGCSQQWQPVGTADVNGDGHPDLMWFNPTTGVLSTWLTDGAGHVVGTQQLNWTCTAASGCSGQWHPIGLADSNPSSVIQ